jgi:hypothetical protein
MRMTLFEYNLLIRIAAAGIKQDTADAKRK